jgi:hypothetical protein
MWYVRGFSVLDRETVNCDVDEMSLPNFSWLSLGSISGEDVMQLPAST